MQEEDFLAFVPELRELKKFPRDYIGNLAYSIIGERFQKFVQNRIKSRNTKLAVTNNMNVRLDSRIAAAFQRSHAVSSKSLNSLVA